MWIVRLAPGALLLPLTLRHVEHVHLATYVSRYRYHIQASTSQETVRVH